MDIVVTGRQVDVSDRFRTHLEEKLAKVEQIAPRVQRIEVHVTHEKNPRQSENRERVELTVWAKGPAVRAEACAADKYAALDLSSAKLLERLRRARDRMKVHHGRRRPQSVAEAVGVPDGALLTEAARVGDPADRGETPRLQPHGDPRGEEFAGTPRTAAETEPPTPEADGATTAIEAEGDCPVVIREKVFPGTPISLDEALARMELVGHDFYLFVDSANGHPSVVYRRRGWSYGVIRLDPELAEDDVAREEIDEEAEPLSSVG